MVELAHPDDSFRTTTVLSNPLRRDDRRDEHSPFPESVARVLARISSPNRDALAEYAPLVARSTCPGFGSFPSVSDEPCFAAGQWVNSIHSRRQPPSVSKPPPTPIGPGQNRHCAASLFARSNQHPGRTAQPCPRREFGGGAFSPASLGGHPQDWASSFPCPHCGTRSSDPRRIVAGSLASIERFPRCPGVLAVSRRLTLGPTTADRFVGVDCDTVRNYRTRPSLLRDLPAGDRKRPVQIIAAARDKGPLPPRFNGAFLP